MTTNYPEKLDRALVRAGRVDRRWEITYANKEQLLQFHAAASSCEMTKIPADEFLMLLPSPATIADAQALLLPWRFHGDRRNRLTRFCDRESIVSVKTLLSSSSLYCLSSLSERGSPFSG